MAKTIYFMFHDAINPETANRLMDFCAKGIGKYQPERLYFLFSSGGGSVDAGVALYNYIRGLPMETVMHNVGNIDSIANAVFLAADVRYATPVSAFLLHGILWNFHKNQSQTYDQLQETLSRFDAAERLAAQIIGERSCLSQEDVRQLFRQGQSKDPQFALEKGFIQEIREVSIEPGAPQHAVVAGG